MMLTVCSDCHNIPVRLKKSFGQSRSEALCAAGLKQAWLRSSSSTLCLSLILMTKMLYVSGFLVFCGEYGCNIALDQGRILQDAGQVGRCHGN